ncbi:hypothetical protein LINPERPRIM_LOCUS33259 [Linum perenne]
MLGRCRVLLEVPMCQVRRSVGRSGNCSVDQ